MSTSNVGYEFDQRSGKKAQKSLKSRKAHKPGATHRRGDEPRDRVIRYRLNGCRLSYNRRVAYYASYDPANWLQPAPKPAPVKQVVVIHETANQRHPNPRGATGREAQKQIKQAGGLRLATR